MDFIIGGYLVGLSVEDMRKRRLPLWVLVIGCIGSSLYGVICRGVFEVLAGIIPGVILIVLSVLLPQSVGVGDGILSVVYGLLYGWQKTCIWLMLGFLLTAVFGIFFSVSRREKGVTVPFVPFLTVVHVGMSL